MYQAVIILLLLFASYTNAQTANKNYVKEKTKRIPVTNSFFYLDNSLDIETTTYFDGLGRPIQIVERNSSPENEKNIVTHIEYEKNTGQVKEYLPFTEEGKQTYTITIPVLGISSHTIYHSNFVANALSKTFSFYNTPHYQHTPNPFIEHRFEKSPRRRTLETAFPGEDWGMNTQNLSEDYRNTVRNSYSLNSANEVKRYKVITTFSNGVYKNTVSDAGYYPENTLYKTTVKNENWKPNNDNNNTTTEFKNAEGNIVLVRTYNDGIAHDTYYIYNDLNLLAFVVPPLANGSVSDTILEQLCYQYNYDSKKRLVEKKLPQKQWEYFVYDKSDRLVMQGPVHNPWGQDTKGWLINKYDAFGRVVYTGFYEGNTFDSSTRYLLSQNHFSSEKKTQSNTIDGISVSYTNNSFPTNFKLLSVNYYDNYQYPHAPTAFPTIEGQIINTNVKSYPTGNWTRILNNIDETSGILSYNLYDNKYRPIRNYASNHLGGFTQKDNKLTFTGLPTQITTQAQYNSQSPIINYTDYFTYDHRDRLVRHTQKIGSQTETISTLVYNPLGVLIQKNIGGTQGNLQNVDLQYNIRNWLTHINPDKTDNDLFIYELSYNKNTENPLYTGDISRTIHSTKQDNITRGYNYLYDNLGRLTKAESLSKRGNRLLKDNFYNESYTYDKNGNLLQLNRNTNINNLEHSIDELQYKYLGNQLKSVRDYTGDTSGFIDGHDHGTDYLYDEFGNITQDLNKKIYHIKYNHLNQPIEIHLSNGKIYYLYNSEGVRLQKRIQPNVGNAVVTDYISGFQYENGVLQFISQPEGYIKPHNGGYLYVYQYKDHLGNIRLSYADLNNNGSIESGSEILEENNYYPFGLRHKGYNEVFHPQQNSAAEKYKFGGKEWNDELDLNLYDFHARNYDPAIGRFLSVDPLGEKYSGISPYVYVANNPIVFVDPDGKQIEPGSQAEWDKQKNAVIAQRDKLQSKIDGLNTKAIEKGWSAEKLSKKMGDLGDRVTSLNNSINILSVLEASTQVYSLNSGATQNEVSFDPSTGNIVISYNGTALFTHEITHAGQFETGDIAFDRTNGATLAQDVYDEVAGYKAQWAYDPKSVGGLKSVNQITPSWVQGITDPSGNQPYRQGGTANTGIAPVNVNSTRDDLIRAYPDLRSTLQYLPASSTLRSVVPTIYAK